MPGPVWTIILLFLFPHITGMMGEYHHPEPLVEMGFLELFAQAGLELLSS
jgi:hypothetical protein